MFNLLFAAAAATLASPAPVSSPAPPPSTTFEEVASGVHLLRGVFVPGAQPDGNTVVLRGVTGLAIVDTGRHAVHTDRVIAFARAWGLPVRAIVNTHWHLDHVSGNPAMRAAFPSAEVHASEAIRGAVAGFLADYRRQLEEMVAQSGDRAARDSFRAEVARIDAGEALFPDRPVTGTDTIVPGGRRLTLHLERGATGGDVWVYDVGTRVVVAGDLVTLPVPLLDTACPARWQQALARLAEVGFTRLVPGHGPVLSPADFASYRRAFDNLLACGASTRARDECVAGWIGDAGALIPEEERAFARTLAGYYVDAHLRGDPARTAPLCG